MTTFDYILFFWLVPATFKLVITIGTMVDALLTYKNIYGLRLNIIGLLFGVVFTTITSGIYVSIFWPMILYREKLLFFKFPDAGMKEYYIEFLKRINKEQ